VLAVRRRRSLRGRWKTATTYMITSLTPFQAGPALLARWGRHHWGVEALRWIRDSLFDEGRSQVRTGNARLKPLYAPFGSAQTIARPEVPGRVRVRSGRAT